MPRIISFLAIIAVMLQSMTACGPSAQAPSTGDACATDAPAVALTAEEAALYDSTVGVLLTQELWTDRDIYDTAHYLMIPMHYAFAAGDMEKINAFAAFFDRFAADVTGVDRYSFQEQGILNRLQFYYFTTQFMVLCAENGCPEKVPGGLLPMIEPQVETVFSEWPSNWESEPSRREHFYQVLAGKQYPFSYYSIIDDADMFLLAILCDLGVYRQKSGTELTAVETEAAEIAYELLTSPLLNEETEDGGWVFQRGVWWDYPDFAYAGYQAILPDMEPKPRRDVTWDSSHFMRMAACIISWRNAQPTQERYALIDERRAQLATQFASEICKKVNGYWLATTFIDGTNGVYRYSYNTPGVGYSGYENSSHVLLGWWGLLEDERICQIYAEILKGFPLEANRDTNPYFDFATIRDQNPFYDDDTSYDLGMYQCMVMCASKLPCDSRT